MSAARKTHAIRAVPALTEEQRADALPFQTLSWADRDELTASLNLIRAEVCDLACLAESLSRHTNTDDPDVKHLLAERGNLLVGILETIRETELRLKIFERDFNTREGAIAKRPQ